MLLYDTSSWPSILLLSNSIVSSPIGSKRLRCARDYGLGKWWIYVWIVDVWVLDRWNQWLGSDSNRLCDYPLYGDDLRATYNSRPIIIRLIFSAPSPFPGEVKPEYDNYKECTDHTSRVYSPIHTTTTVKERNTWHWVNTSIDTKYICLVLYSSWWDGILGDCGGAGLSNWAASWRFSDFHKGFRMG